MLPLFILAHFGHHLLTALPVPLLPMIRDDLALDYTRAGIVASAFSLSYGLSQLPAGWLADRIGPRVMITTGICGVAAAGILVGLSQSYLMIVACLVLMGILGGGYHPSSAPLISSSVEPKNRGRALGLHIIGGSSSFFLAPLAAAAIAAAWGWRGSFIGLAIPATIFGIAFYVLLGRRAPIKKTAYESTRGYTATAPAPSRLRRLAIIILLSTSNQATIHSVTAFIPLYLVDHFGMGKETAAATMALVYSAGLWASPLGGYLSDRLGRIPVLLAACFIAGPVIYSLNRAPYGLGISILLILMGMVVYIAQPVAEAYIVSNTSERRRSSILGIFFFGTMEGGGILTIALGYLIERVGFHLSFTIAAAALLTMPVVCSILLWGSRD